MNCGKFDGLLPMEICIFSSPVRNDNDNIHLNCQNYKICKQYKQINDNPGKKKWTKKSKYKSVFLFTKSRFNLVFNNLENQLKFLLANLKLA